jgi:hypothetical protein
MASNARRHGSPHLEAAGPAPARSRGTASSSTAGRGRSVEVHRGGVRSTLPPQPPPAAARSRAAARPLLRPIAWTRKTSSAPRSALDLDPAGRQRPWSMRRRPANSVPVMSSRRDRASAVITAPPHLADPHPAPRLTVMAASGTSSMMVPSRSSDVAGPGGSGAQRSRRRSVNRLIASCSRLGEDRPTRERRWPKRRVVLGHDPLAVAEPFRHQRSSATPPRRAGGRSRAGRVAGPASRRARRSRGAVGSSYELPGRDAWGVSAGIRLMTARTRGDHEGPQVHSCSVES